jgi:succinyl-CoA synthetase alpha subunit
MAIYIDKNTKLVVQGITGKGGRLQSAKMVEYGTHVVGGVSPGHGGEMVNDDIPVFNTLKCAVKFTGANTSMILVPPKFAADAILEAVDAGIKLIICISEGIPIQDMLRLSDFLRYNTEVRLIGPNSPGIISPELCKVGIMSNNLAEKGKIGLVSRSGTLTYEAVAQLQLQGYGISTAVGIGGDPIIGTSYIDVIKAFEDDDDTDAIVMIGEIGGTSEERAARYIKDNIKKPVVAYIAGMTAPEGTRMGHAGAIISGGKGGAKDKIIALKEAGIFVSESPAEIGIKTKEALLKKDS